MQGRRRFSGLLFSLFALVPLFSGCSEEAPPEQQEWEFEESFDSHSQWAGMYVSSDENYGFRIGFEVVASFRKADDSFFTFLAQVRNGTLVKATDVTRLRSTAEIRGAPNAEVLSENETHLRVRFLEFSHRGNAHSSQRFLYLAAAPGGEDVTITFAVRATHQVKVDLVGNSDLRWVAPAIFHDLNDDHGNATLNFQSAFSGWSILLPEHFWNSAEYANEPEYVIRGPGGQHRFVRDKQVPAYRDSITGAEPSFPNFLVAPGSTKVSL